MWQVQTPRTGRTIRSASPYSIAPAAGPEGRHATWRTVTPPRPHGRACSRSETFGLLAAGSLPAGRCTCGRLRAVCAGDTKIAPCRHRTRRAGCTPEEPRHSLTGPNGSSLKRGDCLPVRVSHPYPGPYPCCSPARRTRADGQILNRNRLTRLPQRSGDNGSPRVQVRCPVRPLGHIPRRYAGVLRSAAARPTDVPARTPCARSGLPEREVHHAFDAPGPPPVPTAASPSEFASAGSKAMQNGASTSSQFGGGERVVEVTNHYIASDDEHYYLDKTELVRRATTHARRTPLPLFN